MCKEAGSNPTPSDYIERVSKHRLFIRYLLFIKRFAFSGDNSLYI